MSLRDVLNAGIGLYIEGEKRFRQALQHLQASYENLRLQGEADQSEAAERLRQSLDLTISGIRNISAQAEERLQHLVDEAGKNYNQLLAGLEAQIDTIRKHSEEGSLKVKIQELSQSLKKQGSEGFRLHLQQLISNVGASTSPKGQTTDSKAADPFAPKSRSNGVESIVFSESD